MNPRIARSITWFVTAALLLAGCATTARTDAAETVATTSASPSAGIGALGEGFWDPENPPPPEGSITPEPGSWDAVHPPAGYTVVLLTFGDDRPTRTLVRAVEAWADDEDVELDTVVAASHKTLVEAIVEAMERQPDLIVSVGPALVDPLAIVSANHLSQQFLVLGAELAEPTENVTAAEWVGAGYRGEGLGTPTEYDASTFTRERADRALRAGVAAVLNGITGFVIWVD